jgi:FkbM family methyltransferase
MSYGSALGQDKWIIEEVFPEKRGGFFIEAGALNGVDESNTVRLERELGWGGLCVEPATGYFERLRRERKCFVENVCLLDREAEVEFLEAGGHGGIKMFFDIDYKQRGRSVKKRAVPLVTLLEQHKAPSVIEYLSLDTEGTEFVILKDFPFNKYRILAITIEHNNNSAVRDELRSLLTRNGYVLCRTVLVDDWWVHESHYKTLDEDRKRLWQLQEKFPPSEAVIRADENLERLNELKTLTSSIPKTTALLWRLIRKRLRGKPV